MSFPYQPNIASVLAAYALGMAERRGLVHLRVHLFLASLTGLPAICVSSQSVIQP